MTAAKKLVRQETYLEAGRVDRAGAAIAVCLATGVYEARRAKSCLVAPEEGDRVLCAVEPEGVYVVAVLEGREGAPTRVTADGDLHLQARGGRVAVTGSEGVDVVSLGPVALTGGEIHVRAPKGSIAVDDLGFFGRLVQAKIAKAAVFAGEIDTVLTRATLRAKRVFRFVAEVDQTRAGTVDLRAEGMVGIRGDNAVLSARTLAKIDGEQIHIG